MNSRLFPSSVSPLTEPRAVPHLLLIAFNRSAHQTRPFLLLIARLSIFDNPGPFCSTFDLPASPNLVPKIPKQVSIRPVQLLPPRPATTSCYHFLLPSSSEPSLLAPPTTLDNHLPPPSQGSYHSLQHFPIFVGVCLFLIKDSFVPTPSLLLLRQCDILSHESTNHHSTTFWIITQIRWLVDLSS